MSQPFVAIVTGGSAGIGAEICAKLLADFHDVPSVGSSGLSFIVGLYRTTAGCLVLVRTQPWVRQVLDITRLSTVIPQAPDIASGLAALHSQVHAAGAMPTRSAVPASIPDG